MRRSHGGKLRSQRSGYTRSDGTLAGRRSRARKACGVSSFQRLVGSTESRVALQPARAVRLRGCADAVAARVARRKMRGRMLCWRTPLDTFGRASSSISCSSNVGSRQREHECLCCFDSRGSFSVASSRDSISATSRSRWPCGSRQRVFCTSRGTVRRFPACCRSLLAWCPRDGRAGTTRACHDRLRARRRSFCLAVCGRPRDCGDRCDSLMLRTIRCGGISSKSCLWNTRPLLWSRDDP